METKILSETTMLTARVALSYPNLLTPSSSPISNGKYGCNLFLFRQSDVDAIGKICNGAYADALQRKWGNVKPSSVEPRVRPIKDGEKAPEGAIAVLICTNSDKPVRTIAADKQLITDPTNPDIYGGQYARAQLRAFGWHKGGKKGVSVAVQAVQILGGGTPLGGGANLDAFDDESGSLAGLSAEPDLSSDLPF